MALQKTITFTCGNYTIQNTGETFISICIDTSKYSNLIITCTTIMFLIQAKLVTARFEEIVRDFYFTRAFHSRNVEKNKRI